MPVEIPTGATPPNEDDAPRVRPAPQIVRIVPLDKAPYSTGTWLSLLLMAATQILILATRDSSVGFYGPIAVLVAIPVAVVLCDLRNQRFHKLRKQLHAEWAGGDVDERDGLYAAWKSSTDSFDIAKLRTRLAEATWVDRSRANVLAFGVRDIPPAGDYRFEPEIITPRDRTPWILIVAVTIVGGSVLNALLSLLMLYLEMPMRQSPAVTWLGFSLAILLTLAAWRWLARPKYLRIAPGMLQTLRFDVWRRSPEVRSYPIDAGTTVLLQVFPVTPARVILYLLRGDQSDRIYVIGREKNRQTVERVWQAIMTTAPTPPLSEEELVG